MLRFCKALSLPTPARGFRMCWFQRLTPRRLLLSVLSLLIVCIMLLVTRRSSEISLPPPLPYSMPLDGVRTFHKYSINCSAIYDMDPVEVGKTLNIRRAAVMQDDVKALIKLTDNCPLFIRVRGYDRTCVSQEEREFPLAFSLVVHKLPWMVERLIRAIYSPSNIYCIHYDSKSSTQFIAAMEGLARCLPNVFISSKLESVYYAGISRLKADLNCMHDLLASEVKWRYIINLCGQDFPLRSNAELVSELRKLNGSNSLETVRASHQKKQRFGFHHELRDINFEYHKLLVNTGRAKAPPPHHIQVFCGSAYFVLSRDFVAHVNSSAVVRDFLEWSEDTYSPDEHFWATLVRLPGVPGEVPRSWPDIEGKSIKVRLVMWDYSGQIHPPCTGKYVRSVCIYGSTEMHWLLNQGSWFANKFDPNVDPVIVQCLEEKLAGIQNLELCPTTFFLY